MPLYHCTGCHHEWEGSRREHTCDWCGFSGEVIANETPLERLAGRILGDSNADNAED